MQDENQRNETEQDENVDYIEAIKELKSNTVPKDQYQRLREENKKLLNAVLNGQEVQGTPKTESVENLQQELKDLKKDLSQAQEEGMSNLEYVSKSLKYRNTAIKLGLQDPFVPNSPLGPDDNDFKTAQKVADRLQEIVDQSNGNPSVFRNLFEELVRDDSKMPKIKKK